MPRVRMTGSGATDEESWEEGDERQLSPSEAASAVARGDGELVREERAENPERSQVRRSGRPETRGR